MLTLYQVNSPDIVSLHGTAAGAVVKRRIPDRVNGFDPSGHQVLCPIYAALRGVIGNRGIMSFISGEQGNTSLKMKGTGGQM